MQGFSINRRGNIFSFRSDTFWLKDSANINLNFQPEACSVNALLRKLRHNNSSTQNQNTARNLLGISSSITFSNESIQIGLQKKEQDLKLLLIPTISGSPYYRNSRKSKSDLQEVNEQGNHMS